MNYFAPDRTVNLEAKKFTLKGAVVTPDYIVAYLGENGQVIDCHRQSLGTYTITSSWRDRHSVTIYQIRANVGGVTYLCRGKGVGMVFRGRRAKTG